MKNLENKIQVLNENRGENSLYEYVIAESQSDPNFFRWFFDDDLDNDFDSSLSCKQKEEFEAWVLEIRKEFLLDKWIVVYFPYADHDDAIRVTLRSNFEKMNFCDAYGNYGQQVGCYDAGCYSFENSGCSIFDDFYSAISKKIGPFGSLMDDLELTTNDLVEWLSSSEDSVSYKTGLDNFPDWGKMVVFYKTWREQNENHTQVIGWTYHDSHNFKTVISEADFGEPDCTELDQDEEIEILLQMPETAPYMEGTNTSEETDDFIFHFDRWATNPWFCYVEKK